MDVRYPRAGTPERKEKKKMETEPQRGRQGLLERVMRYPGRRMTTSSPPICARLSFTVPP